MTARRQASTTSLSKYANFGRAGSPVAGNSNLDFCNAFWGLGDGGVDVLFARLRGAARTVDELRTFWKERAAIEDDYARRLAKLSRTALGRDEIGELRASLDSLKAETEKQAAAHQTLATQLKNDIESPTATFYARQSQHRKTIQSQIEKQFKSKQTQENYVVKAREKYEQDCMRINSYTAQSSLVQGRDLEKINQKLERAQQTIHANELEFANFAKALGESTLKWEKDWKAFCDSAQDLEEDRLDVMKDVMWGYANAISTVCVADDQSCEKMRLSLETVASETEMENFVRDYGTGNEIPDPPAFVNYTAPEAIPSSSVRPTYRPSQFIRISQRNRRDTSQPQPHPDDDPQTNEFEEPANMVGVGAVGKRASQPDMQAPPTTTSRRSSTRSIAPEPSSSRRPTSAASHKSTSPAVDANGQPLDPSAENYIKIGGNAYKVDLSRDPQSSHLPPSATSPSPIGSAGSVDPLARQMEELRRSATSATSNPRRTSTMGRSSSPNKQSAQLTLPPPSAGSSSSSSPAPRDYRNSAEVVVGTLPTGSRPSSPSQPTPVFMQPPRSTPSPAQEHIDTTINGWGQPLPGEKRNSGISRSRSPSLSVSPADPARLGRKPSMGHAGVGAHGRSRSPSPAPSPHHAQPQQSMMRPPSSTAGRATSPIGIALDPSGRVVVDDMAQRYQQQPAAQPQYSRPPSQAGPPPQQSHPQVGYSQAQPQQQRRTSYMGQPQQGYPQQPPQQYQQPPQRQPSYGAPSPVAYSQPSGFQQAQPYQHQPPPSQVNVAGYYNPPPVQQQVPPQPQVQQLQQYHQPPPGTVATVSNGGLTGQLTEDGKRIMFYVKALYDYQASIEEEFDFQANDVIAVTATPEDGWWSGELLDEKRRVRGRHVFPSNFVCLF
ncbi:SH3 domain-containing protein [Flagelloscypha sp. PMI_526]|nr:SH3 domain-containing protein [Flagelloscypha sp. PMI_526]